MGVTTLLLLLIRPSFVVVIFALVLVGAVLLAVRQIVERRLLYWNMVAPCIILTAGALLLPLLFFSATPSLQRLKHYPSDGGGAQKTAFSAGERVATVVTYLPRAATDEGGVTSRVGRLVAAADKAAYRVGIIRRRFSASYTEAGSGVDRSVRFDDFKSFILYLPRAFAIGFWAPFPDTWVAAGQARGERGEVVVGCRNSRYLRGSVAGARGRHPAAAETRLVAAVGGHSVRGDGARDRRPQHRGALQIPLHILGAVARAWRQRSRKPPRVAWAGASAAGDGSVRLSQTGEPDGGGLPGVFREVASRGQRELIGRAAACVALAWVLGTACACASNAGADGRGATARETVATTTNAATVNDRVGKLGFTLVNLTGTQLRAVYVSPNSSGGWEENVVGDSGLAEGGSVELRFSPEEKAAVWDLRVEGAGEHFAEWKGLRLGGVSKITLYLDVVGERIVAGERVVVAEVE